MNVSPPRTHDEALAREYREVDPFRLRDVRELQKHLASAQALIRLQAARPRESDPRGAAAGAVPETR